MSHTSVAGSPMTNVKCWCVLYGQHVLACLHAAVYAQILYVCCYVCAGPVSDLNRPAPRRFLLIDIKALHNMEGRKERGGRGEKWKEAPKKVRQKKEDKDVWICETPSICWDWLAVVAWPLLKAEDGVSCRRRRRARWLRGMWGGCEESAKKSSSSRESVCAWSLWIQDEHLH